jgi:heme/copper-type cytochrome/quinol oxidase subunit 1
MESCCRLYGAVHWWAVWTAAEASEHRHQRISNADSLGIKTYYQGLTLHGVLNALVFTTFFIIAFFTYAISRSLEREQKYPKVHWLAFILMAVGLVVAAVPILGNAATVLYTFYPPMEASFFFYLGLVLVVVGSWVAGYGFYFTLAEWRKDNPGESTPFIALAGCRRTIIKGHIWSKRPPFMPKNA